MNVAQTALVSVALCTYNGERYLRPQLESVLRQTYRNIEVITFDDGSSDGTLELLAEYAAQEPRLKIVQNPRRLGFRQNFELALGRCRGEFIALCDQDDIWHLNKLAILVEAITQHEGTLLAFCNSELINAEGQSLGARIDAAEPSHPYSDPISYIYQHRCSGHTILMRRSLVNKAIPIPKTQMHDWWLAFVAASCGSIVYVDPCLVRYRRHAESVIVQEENVRKDRAPGFRSRELAEIEERLALFAGFPGREQLFFQQLLSFWQSRNNALISANLAAFLLRHRKRVFPYDTPLRGVRLSLKCLWGLRLKRLLEPHRYQPALPMLLDVLSEVLKVGI